MKKIIISLDQGTSSSRAIAFDANGEKIACQSKEFPQIFPEDGWVEHDPAQIWESQYSVFEEVLRKVGAENVAAIGIANQRETTIVWDANTGEPIYNAIVWQDRRTSGYCDFLSSRGYDGFIKSKTGLRLDSYFSGTKIKWILDHVEGARQKAKRGELRFGTVDTFLLWKLTGGKVHATDVSNASRTMLFNIHTLKWDSELLNLLDIPESILPEVFPSSHHFGDYVTPSTTIPICSLIGDQQSALFGQMCVEQGSVKNTYGTGCFLLMNIGEKSVCSKCNLLTTIAWEIGGKVTYALEGSVFVCGAAVQWLRDGLGIIKSSSEVETLALSVEDNGGVFFVPALTGLAAPYWNARARGTIIGINRGTKSAHIARAVLEGMAFEVRDLVNAMSQDASIKITEIKVDGGASDDSLLLQFQSDILNTRVLRPSEKEITALGAAYMAGLTIGLWNSIDELKSLWREARIFEPSKDDTWRKNMIKGWEKAIRAALTE